jgi:hypothetical protein
LVGQLVLEVASVTETELLGLAAGNETGAGLRGLVKTLAGLVSVDLSGIGSWAVRVRK